MDSTLLQKPTHQCARKNHEQLHLHLVMQRLEGHDCSGAYQQL